MITSHFCKEIIYRCNLLGLTYFGKLDPITIKNQCIKLLFSESIPGFMVYASYQFFIKHKLKIIKARSSKKYNDAISSMIGFSKKTIIKTIKNPDQIVLTNFFENHNNPQTIEYTDGEFYCRTITKFEIKEAKKSGKRYKTIPDGIGNYYIFDKNHLNKNAPIASYRNQIFDDDKYVYYIKMNTTIGKNAALKNIAKIQATKAIQLAIYANIITLNSRMLMNAIRPINRMRRF